MSTTPSVPTFAAGWQQATRYPDPAIVALDPRFEKYWLKLSCVERIATGCRWAEGPVYFGDGRYLLWSDIPNNRILKWEEETGAVSVYRKPSNFANGHTRDRQGRLIGCSHGGRCVTRTEYDGSITVLIDSFGGKRLNSPNDVVVHPDGGIWFTDPSYGIRGNYEGFRADSETKEAVYRADPKSGQVEKVFDQADQPNGLCFSPDYKRLYIADTGMPRDIKVFDVDGKSLRNGKRHAQLSIPGSGAPSAADGMRCDADGNIWAGARPGVLVIAPTGETIGMIRLPETCANVCFGGARRNRLFMTASQSLYAVYVDTTGGHIA